MNVLILSDFSDVAINATHYAMDLLEHEQVTFTLLNIHVPDPESSEEVRRKKRAAIREKLQERVDKLNRRAAERPHVVKGYYSEKNLLNATRAYVNKNHIDLLVMGAVGKDKRHSTILGDHTFEIVSKVKCNILAVPEDVQFSDLQRILMPIDYSVSLRRKNLKFLYSEKFFQEAVLNVKEIGNTVESHQRSFKQELFSDLNDMQIIFSTLDGHGNFDEELWTQVQRNYDLIALLGKNLSICDQLMHSTHGLYTSVPNRLPILVLHD